MIKVQPIMEESSNETNNQMNTNEMKTVNKTLVYFLPIMTFILLIVASVVGLYFGLKLWEAVESSPNTQNTLGMHMVDQPNIPVASIDANESNW